MRGYSSINDLSQEQMLRKINGFLTSLNEGDVIRINKREMDVIELISHIVSRHMPLKVTEYASYLQLLENSYYYYEICPCCGGLLDRTYQAHCDKCGQRLRWISIKDMSSRQHGDGLSEKPSIS